MRRTGRGRGWLRRSVVLAAGAVAVLAVTMPAAGAAGQEHRLPFGNPLGLSTSRAAELQGRIDDGLRRATAPGKQNSQSTIAFENGAVVMGFAVPGIANTYCPVGGTHPGAGSGWMCVYDDYFYQGAWLQYYECGRYSFKPYAFEDRTSSWINDQTPGTSGWLYSDSGVGGYEEFAYSTAQAYEPQMDPSVDDKADGIVLCE
ncbi:hypothetical protein [Amycolatopsis sp. WGS_07]|uniref:hypothetical protein n=1 Tax=Amycolatopsis sp. WGS_07 TaxID=3076764 RepID=UPI003872DC06